MTPMRRAKGYVGGAVVVLTATVAYLMIQLPAAVDSAENANRVAERNSASVAALEKQYDDLAKAMDTANRKLVAAGKAPVPVPTPTPVPPPANEGLTAADLATIREIAAAEVARAKTPISQAEITQIARVAASFVPKPKDGKSVTVAELQPLITVALATYCANDRCVGKPGKDGVDGDDGTNGQDAAKVTDEQLRPLIAESFVSYCAQESKPCEGKLGPQGPPGATGPQGVGIADTDCVGEGADSYWRIHYTDGTEGKSLGPCRLPTETTPVKKGN